ncbi:hypothetical protein A3SI_05112 [Nitritalea halalkaliphila LW7]|uniref:Uncharacterized protein n=1 Tax=Nitritalea halalkaliphila LW7 TaxID=1189621 RepID=I5C861_9BACT|nr:hypothetical protein A3SI_05112 [Nitritalea halalkaliphila LW7]
MIEEDFCLAAGQVVAFHGHDFLKNAGACLIVKVFGGQGFLGLGKSCEDLLKKGLRHGLSG